MVDGLDWPERTPLDNRKCKMCNTLEVEFHFILESSLYRDIRKQLISKYFGVGRICQNLLNFACLKTENCRKI